MIPIGYIGEKESIVKRVVEDPNEVPAPTEPSVTPAVPSEPVPAGV